MKIYRYVARAGRQKKMHGIFRGLDPWACDIPDGAYENAMGKINSILPVPTKEFPKETTFWFTEKGKNEFEKDIDDLLTMYFSFSPKYIKEWDILEEEIEENDKRILYSDCFQLAVNF